MKKLDPTGFDLSIFTGADVVMRAISNLDIPITEQKFHVCIRDEFLLQCQQGTTYIEAQQGLR